MINNTLLNKSIYNKNFNKIADNDEKTANNVKNKENFN